MGLSRASSAWMSGICVQTPGLSASLCGEDEEEGVEAEVAWLRRRGVDEVQGAGGAGGARCSRRWCSRCMLLARGRAGRVDACVVWQRYQWRRAAMPAGGDRWAHVTWAGVCDAWTGDSEWARESQEGGGIQQAWVGWCSIAAHPTLTVDGGR